MAATTWTWKGGTGLSTVALNWTRTSGPGNALNVPTAGDVVIVPAGVILDGLSEMSGQGTITVKAGATIAPSIFQGINLGTTAGTSGTLAVTGAGAKLVLANLSTGVVIGSAGTGALLVQNGGSVVDTTMVLGGNTSGPNGGIGTLALTGGSDAQISGGLTLWDGSTISVDATSGIDLGTSNSFSGGAVVVEAADSLIGSGTIAAAVVNNGTISVQNDANLNSSTGGSLEITGALSGNGTISIQPGATLQLDGSLASTQAIKFVRGGPETLILDAPVATITNSLTGFNEGDIIALPGGVTITSAVVNGTTLAIGYQNANGTSGAYDFTNFAYGPNPPQSLVTGGDPFTGGVFVMATNFFDWSNLGGGNYSDSTNWDLGRNVPGISDVANFDFGSGGTITGPGTAAIMNFLSGATWAVASGSSLFAAIGLQVGVSGGAANSIATLNIGAGATIESGGTIGVGIFSGDIGSLNISGGGLVRDSLAAHPWAGMNIGQAAGSGTLSPSAGTVTVIGAGSFLNVGLNPLDLASDGGSGSLTVAQGGSVEAASVDSSLIDALGIGGLGNATVTVTDPGSRLTSTGVAMIAQAGTSGLTIENSGVFQALADPTGLAGLDVGAGSTAGVGGLGIATVTTSGVLNSSGYVNVGMRGVSGQLSVFNGGTVQVGTTMTVGAGGTIGNGTTEVGNGTLSIGSGGTVQLTGTPQTLSDGVYLGDSNIGTASVETAVATINGGGALLNAGGRGISVGQYGTAALTVSLGGIVISGAANSSLIPALTLGRGGIGTVTVTGAGSKLTANGAASVGQAGSGSLMVRNQGSVLIGLDNQGFGGLNIGGGAANAGGTLYAGGTGTALVDGGGDLFSQTTIGVGENGASGLLTVLSGGTVDAGTQLLIGASTILAPGSTLISPAGTTTISSTTVETATGAIIVGAGGLLKAGGNGIALAGTAAIVVGAGLGSVGTVDVSGAGATLTGNGQGLDVGLLGQGALVVNQGGTVLAGTQFTSDAAIGIGVSAGVVGAMTVTDLGSLIQASGQIDVGGAGRGALTVQNRGTVQSGGSALAPSQGLDVARNAGGTGRVTVTGAQSLLTNTGAFIVGDGGLGSVNIDSGGTLMTSPGTVTGLAAMVIANSPGASGSNVTISGPGSVLRVSGLLDVGAGGSGGFQLSGGAAVTIAALDAGNVPSAVGQISLTDAGTQLTVTGTATVADDGTGVLSVLNGATFAAQSLTIGSKANSSGALVVSGNGSAVDLSGALNIGTALGIGDLTVGPGAVVHASVVNLQGQVVLEGGLLDPTVQLINQGQTVGGFGTIAAGDIVDEGVIQAGANKASQKLLLVVGTVSGGGTLTVNGSQPGSNNAGILQINAGGTMELTGAVLNAATTTFTDNLTPSGTYIVNNSVVDVTFADAAGVLKLDDIAGFAGTITTFQAGDSFVISGGTLSGPNISNGNTLTMSDAGPGAGVGGIDSIIFASPINAAGFNIVNGNTVQVACFAAGTRIETDTGLVAVETLAAGDEVRTILGGPGRIVWIGSRTVDCGRHPRPEMVRPVRIARGAFGEDVPVRDLFVSPDHAIYVDGVLIPARYLVNGSTVRQVKWRRVLYYHVELARHDVMLAEGLPAESYLETGDRANSSGGNVMSLHPNFSARTWEMEGCAELVVTGRRLVAARQRVNARAVRTCTKVAVACPTPSSQCSSLGSIAARRREPSL